MDLSQTLDYLIDQLNCEVIVLRKVHMNKMARLVNVHFESTFKVYNFNMKKTGH